MMHVVGVLLVVYGVRLVASAAYCVKMYALVRISRISLFKSLDFPRILLNQARGFGEG